MLCNGKQVLGVDSSSVRVLLLSNVSVLDIVRVHALRDDENLGDKGELVPHADGAAALNLALRYLEQQAGYCYTCRYHVYDTMVKLRVIQ
ncbi:hypothetical protein J6590_041280 [Homalodisca vitripennis]|nr:hypothetical protein J6590_041280 [Homalodisca vitripennis]